MLIYHLRGQINLNRIKSNRSTAGYITIALLKAKEKLEISKREVIHFGQNTSIWGGTHILLRSRWDKNTIEWIFTVPKGKKNSEPRILYPS